MFAPRPSFGDDKDLLWGGSPRGGDDKILNELKKDQESVILFRSDARVYPVRVASRWCDARQ